MQPYSTLPTSSSESECAATIIRPRPDRVRSWSLKPHPEPRHTKTAFVLSGGGTRGALHVGGLRALLERGIQPDFVVGTSIGAWNAAWLARTPTLAGVDELAHIWCSLRPTDILLGSALHLHSTLAQRFLIAWNALRRVAGGHPSLYSNHGLYDVLHRYFGSSTFEDLSVPLHVVAANLTHGGRTVFSGGALVPAVLASSAIPGIFPPVKVGNSFYADGGTVDGCSIETAVELGAGRIIVLAIGYDTELDGSTQWQHNPAESASRWERDRRCSAATAIQRASQIMGNYQIARALERVPAGIETHVIPLTVGSGSGSLSFRDIPSWIESAYAGAQASIATLDRQSATTMVSQAPELKGRRRSA